jgi:phage baseplate assembly protein W
MKDLKYIAAIKDVPTAFNDIEIGADGDIVTLAGTARVKQDVVKILLTELGLLPYPNYGTSLPTLPGTESSDPSLLNSVSSEVISAVQYLVLNEESQVPSELIDSLKTLSVSYAASAINIAMTIVTKDQAEVDAGFTV